MSELPGDSGLPDMSPMNGVGGVGGGSQISEALDGPLAGGGRPMARTPGLVPRRLPGIPGIPDIPGIPGMPGMMTMPHIHPLHLLELHEQRMFHHYLHTNPLIPTRLLRDIEERRRIFVEGCKAREAAFDANPPQMDSDARAFTLALTASDTRGPTAD